MISSLLIANRGEIACRIARTAHDLGIRTIAVYSEADREALHVKACDEAYPIGPAAARESYLVADKILEVAKQAGAEAIHPGYGFLSENAAFAKACEDAGIIFVGPPASAIEAMGSKAGAKALMAAAEVPLVPGYHGEDQSPETLAQAVREIGYPVLLKASAGGGGKGMRVVSSDEELEAGIAAAAREGEASFGDSRLIVERYLTKPRHVEIQVFADSHGNVLHLFERDCSAQRRHQKVLEEAPAPGLPVGTRYAMGEAAVQAARAVGYVGAGTVEFIMDEDGSFYFMEMNTRLQVEHPVTEEVTGLDLVALQLRVASGEAIPFSQDDLHINGHSVEVRLYAEDPARDFFPQTGKLHHLRLPSGPGIRVDAGVEQGGEVSVHYDPMIAKIITHGPTREAAFFRMKEALADTEVVGVTTNISFLSRLVANEEVRQGGFDTGLIGRAIDSLAPGSEEVPLQILQLAAVSELARIELEAQAAAARTEDPLSPWSRADGWRGVLSASVDFTFEIGEARHALSLTKAEDIWRVEAEAKITLFARPRLQGTRLLVSMVDDSGAETPLSCTVVACGHQRTVILDGEHWGLSLYDPIAELEAAGEGAGHLTAPMPAKVIAVHVTAGDPVPRGKALVVLEAMKMEHTISAPMDGTIACVAVSEGDLVEEGAELVAFEQDED